MVEVIYDKLSGRSRGFAFVTMSSVEEAEAAAQQFNGYELQGRPIRVNSGPPPPKRENSFGGNRGQDREFSSFGGRGRERENSSYGGRGRENSSYGGRGRENSSYGGRGRENSSYGGRENSSYGGRENSSYGGRERTSFDNTNRVYVGNLSWGVDDQTLESVFSEQGKVKEAKVVYDRENGRSRGFGFVTYSSVEEVNNAVESLDGMDLNGRSIRGEQLNDTLIQHLNDNTCYIAMASLSFTGSQSVSVEEDACMQASVPLEIVLTVIRSIVDVFYIIQILVRFRTAYVAPSSRVYGRGELVIDSSKIASRYLHKDFGSMFISSTLPQVIGSAVPVPFYQLSDKRIVGKVFAIFSSQMPLCWTDLVTSTYIGEINFAMTIAILGLVFFALLIGNMQVPLFDEMDGCTLDAICERLKPFLCTPELPCP
ncbi:hypothetical protein BUALT_Bualt09G0069800 [Buddleja alternifolia]|uniref:RRM domain-containing protein n=1 Tax=Buddleja alternifolia TaxID=168488 RepID=A0AAV6X0L6_9LAMI|nr:hypothetical protein BUALT_Bualt09G0069800 [Buddleja alternifolia]